MSAALIERLERATAPDRGLDALLAVVAGWEWHGDGAVEEYPRWAGHWVEPGDPMNGTFGKRGRGLCDCDTASGVEPPTYTGSIDAALAFIQHTLPDWGWSVGEPLRHPGHWASVWREGFSIDESGHVWRAEEGRTGLQPDKSTGAGEIGVPKKYAPTPAVALLLAALKAMAADSSFSDKAGGTGDADEQ